MTRKKKRVLGLASAFIMLIILWAAILFATLKGTFTEVSFGKFQLQPIDSYLMTPNGCVFDTGAECSVIFDDSLPSIPVVGATFTFDSARQMKVTPLSFLQTLQISKHVSISNILSLNQKGNALYKVKGVRMIIGTNAMSKANWLFSFKKNTAEALPLDQFPKIPSHAVCIPFSDNFSPTTQLKIRETAVDFLIDTGYDGDLTIADKTVLQEICNGQKFKTDTVNFQALFGEYSEPAQTFDEITIEGKSHKNIVIRESRRNLLGLNFIRRFSTMFWDSANCKMWLWNEK